MDDQLKNIEETAPHRNIFNDTQSGDMVGQLRNNEETTPHCNDTQSGDIDDQLKNNEETAPHCNIHNDNNADNYKVLDPIFTDWPVTEVLLIPYNKNKYDTRLQLYMKNVLNIENPDELSMKETWIKLITHILAEILSRICKIDRVMKDPIYAELPTNSAKCKSITILELYSDNYDVFYNDAIGIQRLALFPNSDFEIINRYKTFIICHISHTTKFDNVFVNFYNVHNDQQFQQFFNSLVDNFQPILDGYFNKIDYYYIFGADREYCYERVLLTEGHNVDIQTNSHEIQRHQKHITLIASREQLLQTKYFLEKFNLKSDVHTSDLHTQKIWCELAALFLKDILSKVYAFTFKQNTHSLQFDSEHFLLSFDITCQHDILLNRKRFRSGDHFRNGLL